MKTRGRITKWVVCVASGVISWLMLSFYFFPLDLYAPIEEYIGETMTHMVPLKAFITLIFVLLSLFIYEQKTKHSDNSKQEKGKEL